MVFTFGIAWAVRVLVPTGHWYRTAFLVSEMLGPATRYLRRHEWNGPLSQAVFVNRVLAFLTRSGRAFPIPWEAEGLETVRRFRAQGGSRGVIFCSAHLPLIKVGCRALMDSGIYLDGAIAANPTVTDSVAVWGRTERMPAIQANWMALVRTRTLLRQGKAVFLLVDDRPGGALHPAIFRMASRLNCELFLFSVDLGPTGTVLVRFFQAAGNSEEAATTALRDEVNRIVERRICRRDEQF